MPAKSSAQQVRARDYELVLPGGRHVGAKTDAKPKFRDGRLAAGKCVAGLLDWNETAGQRPEIVDTRTGASWKPKCASSGLCSDPASGFPSAAP